MTTPLQEQCLQALLTLGGSGTSAQVAGRIGDRTARSVSVALQYLRGAGLVSDGSTSKPLSGGGMAWSPAPGSGPTVWSLTEEGRRDVEPF